MGATTLAGYELRRSEPLDWLGGTYLELEHRQTGARHIHIAYDDDNNAFRVSLPTIPADSTGVAHILEHVVLAGSRRYPVRDPFFSILKRSLSTYMNAHTSADHTGYPFSTRNRADFFNLLDVYLDAVFFPRLAEDSFKQEGHRLEFEAADDAGSGLRFKGIVFNEMKATLSMPHYTLARGLGQALFPGLPYAHSSGGDPEAIPGLSWRQLREFHARHYHPSNAHFFTSGNLPLDEILAVIDPVISSFERRPADIGVPAATPGDAAEVRLPHPMPPGGDPRRGQVLIGWVTGHTSDSFEMLAEEILVDVLLDNPNGPLRRALIDSGLGSELADVVGLIERFRQAVFTVGLKDADPDAGDRVEAVVLSALERLATEGLDPALVDARIHQMEFHRRERSNSGLPFSLGLWHPLSSAELHGGDPHRALDFERDLATLERERREGPLFQRLIRERFLDNPHRARVVLVPDPGLESRRQSAELARLAAIEADLRPDERAAIVEDALRLRAEQERQEDLSSLPKLSRADIPPDIVEVPVARENLGGLRVAFFPQPTNGITYLDLRADVSGLEGELLDLLALFAYVLPQLGAGAEDHLRMAARIRATTGGVFAATDVAVSADGERVVPWLRLGGRALVRNQGELTRIVADLVTGARFEPARVRELLRQVRAELDSSIAWRATHYVQLLAAAKVVPAALLEERIEGLTHLHRIRRLSELGDADLAALCERLEALRGQAFGRDQLALSVTAEERDIADMRRALGEALDGLPDGRAAAPANLATPPGSGSEARTGAFQVAFNCEVFPTVPYRHPDSPALAVLGALLTGFRLHREIREKGGAYGGTAAADTELGTFDMLSYRDPNVGRTYAAFEDAVRWVTGERVEPEELESAVLMASRSVDPLESPDTRGTRAARQHLGGYTIEVRRRFKQGLLAVTEADVRRVAAAYLTRRGSRATIAGAPLVEAANREAALFESVSEI